MKLETQIIAAGVRLRPIDLLRIVRLSEAAKLLGQSKRSLCRQVAVGQLPPWIMVGPKVRGQHLGVLLQAYGLLENATPEFLTTAEKAEELRITPHTLRQSFRVHGHYYGLRPTKGPNGLLRWPTGEGVKTYKFYRSLNGKMFKFWSSP